jgi:pimeloyl-ACP methyl ester carboxylesterase
MHTRLYALLVAFAIAGCDGSSTHTIRVFENRAARSGKQIDLHVVVLHATSRPVAPDPVVWLTGGPGAAAADDPRGITQLFSQLNVHHDIVLVDQRGTGRSAPLDCPIYDRANLQPYFDTMWPLERIRDCRRRLSARSDLTQYTTANAMDDLADVLTALGYARADLIGASYGTQAALVFLRRHPDRVRRVVLNGVAPPDQVFFSWVPRTITRELAVIDPDHVVDSAIKRLPVTVTLWNWRRVRRDMVTITRRGFAERLFILMYTPSRGRRAINALRHALTGDWVPFAKLALMTSEWQHDRSIGMQLSVLCAENAQRLAHADTATLGTESPLGLPIAPELLAACAEWPRGLGDTTRVTGSVPVLLISGGLDPATPPELADSAALGLPNSIKFVDSTAGHAMFYGKQVAELTSFILNPRGL